MKLLRFSLRIRAMHEANTALLDILVDNSVIIPKGSLSDFEKVVYYLNSRPECPEVADFAVFCVIHSTYP